MDSARALVTKGWGIALVGRAMSVSRAQLSLRIKRSADRQDRRCNRLNDEADAEILSDILDIISDMLGYGYRRVWGTETTLTDSFMLPLIRHIVQPAQAVTVCGLNIDGDPHRAKTRH